MIGVSNIRLQEMTLELARQYFRDFSYDSAVFTEEQPFPDFIYDENWVKWYVSKQRQQRKHLAVMLGERPVGEIILKKIHEPHGSCTLSVHLQNDSVKNQGLGTMAERLAVQYAFQKLRLETIYADTLKTNTRSQHVLQGVGFVKTDEDDAYVYYRCGAAQWSWTMEETP